jgi:hypothetical protein
VDEVVAGSSVVLRTIDEAGNFVGASTEYFNDHPTYSGIAANVAANGQDMAFIPPFYIKFWRDPDIVNHVRYFISPHAKEGFTLHPAFRVADAAGGFLYGRCLNTVAYNAASSPNSLKASGALTAHGISLTQGSTMCVNMNSGGESGWHVVTIWEDRAIVLLLRMVGLTYFPQTRWGGEIATVTASGIPPTDAQYGRWRDIYAFWAPTMNYTSGQHNKIVAGISVNTSKVISISVPETPATPAFSFGAIASPTTSWATKIRTGFNSALNVDLDLILVMEDILSNTPGVNGNRNVIGDLCQVNTIGAINFKANSIGIAPPESNGWGYLRIAKWL